MTEGQRMAARRRAVCVRSGLHLLLNRDTYLSAPVHYQSLQAAALANFNNTWTALVNACSNPSLGAGQSCISDPETGWTHPEAERLHNEEAERQAEVKKT
jgi:hypothetical protein